MEPTLVLPSSELEMVLLQPSFVLYKTSMAAILSRLPVRLQSNNKQNVLMLVAVLSVPWTPLSALD